MQHAVFLDFCLIGKQVFPKFGNCLIPYLDSQNRDHDTVLWCHTRTEVDGVILLSVGIALLGVFGYVTNNVDKDELVLPEIKPESFGEIND